MLLDSGLTEAIFAGIGANEARFGIEVIGNLRKKVDFPLALASFFAACDTKQAIAHARRLKPSRAHNRHLRFLLERRGALLEPKIPLAQLKLLLAEPYFSDLYELQRAIQKARGESIGPLLAIKKRARPLKAAKLPRPLLNGHELIALGVQPGPMVGLVAEELYIAQLSEELSTDRQARRWVTQWLRQHDRFNH